MLSQKRMLIARCAWHAFFRGYPRPLRVVSWRGRGVAFSDTICRSCADRVRIEGLWGSSPPPPVWPGSAQTALIFVGLPLFTALVLLATPLHDPGPPPREEAAAASPAGDLPAPEPGIAARDAGASAMPRAVSKRRSVDDRAVPAVIYETRRTRHRVPENAGTGVRSSAPAVVAVEPASAWLPPAPRAAERIKLAAAPANAERRATAASLAPQSP